MHIHLYSSQFLSTGEAEYPVLNFKSCQIINPPNYDTVFALSEIRKSSLLIPTFKN